VSPCDWPAVAAVAPTAPWYGALTRGDLAVGDPVVKGPPVEMQLVGFGQALGAGLVSHRGEIPNKPLRLEGLAWGRVVEQVGAPGREPGQDRPQPAPALGELVHRGRCRWWELAALDRTQTLQPHHQMPTATETVPGSAHHAAASLGDRPGRRPRPAAWPAAQMNPCPPPGEHEPRASEEARLPPSPLQAGHRHGVISPNEAPGPGWRERRGVKRGAKYR
jgi:hypothetical protein